MNSIVVRWSHQTVRQVPHAVGPVPRQTPCVQILGYLNGQREGRNAWNGAAFDIATAGTSAHKADAGAEKPDSLAVCHQSAVVLSAGALRYSLSLEPVKLDEEREPACAVLSLVPITRSEGRCVTGFTLRPGMHQSYVE